MNWSWDPRHWQRSIKLLLGIATIWPPLYMLLFMLSIFSIMLLIPLAQDRSTGDCGSLDLIQLMRKIKNGELKQLTVRREEIVAKDRVGNCEYQTSVTNEASRAEILREAREVSANGEPRVARIEEESERPASRLFPVGIVTLFGAHLFTIFLIMGLMPLYIILVVKSDHLDQTMKIVWAVLICMAGMFAMPVFWYLYIWRGPSAKLPGASVTQSSNGPPETS